MKSPAGVEHEFAHNLTFTGRFVYRDLRRIIEDMSGENVTQALHGVPQLYVVGNPSKPAGHLSECDSLHFGPELQHLHRLHQLRERQRHSDSAPTASRTASRIPIRSTSRWSSLSANASRTFSSTAATCFRSCMATSGLVPQRQWPAGSQHQLDVRFHQLRWRAHRPGYSRRPDRATARNQFKMFANYQWKGFTFGASWTPTSGTPITDLLDHPAYQNARRNPGLPQCDRSATPFHHRYSRRRSPALEDLVARWAARHGFSPSMCMASTP